MTDLLPSHLWTAVFERLLGHWEFRFDRDGDRAPFSGATRLLRQALWLAVVCRQWREAVAPATVSVLAGHAPNGYELHYPRGARQLLPDPRMPPRFLSPLLGELVTGLPSITLHWPLLASADALRFLEIARPELLYACTGYEATEGVDLSSCTSLLRLYCFGDIMPTGLPPGLQQFTLYEGCGLPFDTRMARALMADLCVLEQLTTLVLIWGRREAGVLLRAVDCWQGFPALQKVTFRICCTNETRRFRFKALRHLNTRGISVELCLELCLEDYDQPTLELWHSLATGLVRLQTLPLLGLLNLLPKDLDLAAAHPQLLAAFSCWELVLRLSSPSRASPVVQLLPGLRCDALYCHLCMPRGLRECDEDNWSTTWSWQLLSKQPGIYVLGSSWESSVYIDGCSEDQQLPNFSQAWAVVVARPIWLSVEGLPWGVLTRGPRGLRMWRNSAAPDSMIERACELLL